MLRPLESTPFKVGQFNAAGNNYERLIVTATGGAIDPIPPKAFLSHASEDKDRFVQGLAERLRVAGVDAWFDEWEIKGGDSLLSSRKKMSSSPARLILSEMYRRELNSAVKSALLAGVL